MPSFSRDITVHPAVFESAAASHISAVPAVDTSAIQSDAFQNRLIYFRNPALSGLYWLLPRPRSDFALPTLMSPTPTPDDHTLFDEPQTGGQQHYLPAYGLATTGSGNQAQFAVSLAPSSSGYLLTVKLTDVTDLSIVSNRKAELPPTLYMLSATLPDRTESWSFPNATVGATSITLTMPISDPAERDLIYTAMTNQSLQPKLILRRSPSLALPVPLATPVSGQPPPQQLYRQSAVAIDTVLDFFFDKNLDQNVFASLPNVGSGQPSTLSHAAIPYPSGGAKSYSYWQDPLQPGNIYFLPDAYKIARLATSPHTPAINITTSGSDPATLGVTLTFLALPVWDPNRISAAEGAPLCAAFGIPRVENVSVLPATNTQLLLNLPSTDPSASNAPVVIANASIDMANGIQASVTLSLTQFQQVYNAIFVTPSVLLSGQVNVTVGGNTEQVPFSGRASDFVGAIIDSSISYDASTNLVTVVGNNAIESPIHIGGLTATVVRNGNVVPTTVVSVSPSFPVNLDPQQAAAAAATPVTTPTSPSAVTFVLQLATGQSFDRSDTVQLDLSQVTVLPDSRAIWEAIVEHQVVPPVKKEITVQLPAEVFPPQTAPSTGASAPTTSSAVDGASSTVVSGTDPSAQGGTSHLLAVQVIFQDGQTVTFQPSMTAVGGLYTQTIGLNVAIEDYVLGQGDSSNYTYRVDTITGSGVEHGDWITTNVDDLFVTLGV